MTKRRTLLAVALLAPFAAFALASGSLNAGSLDDTQQVKKLATDFKAAWNKHEPKTMAALWAKDGDLIDPWGKVSNGRDEVEKFFTGEHTGTGQLAKSTYDIKKDSVRFITPDVALSDWDVIITGLAKSDGSVSGPMFHRVVVISKKEGSDWKVAAARPGIPQPEGEKTPAHSTPKPTKP